MTITVDGRTLTIDDVVQVACHGQHAALDDASRQRMTASRDVVEDHLREGRVEYGITTGLGELKNVRIDTSEVVRLQHNLLRSHACGVGDPLGDDVVRAMLLLRANALARGVSGVRPVLVDTLLKLLERGITPIVPSKGSVGSSGDLVPLAHMALVLVGEGEARFQGKQLPGRDALEHAAIEPLELEAKEGLALINGTQLQAAIGTLLVHHANVALKSSQIAAAMTTEALMGSVAPFTQDIVDARPHPGAVAVAANMRQLLAESDIVDSHADCQRVQDAYSMRCIPQVLGAAVDAVAALERVVAVEINSATDNPLVLEDGRVLSGGNFHGEPLGQFLGLAASALAKAAVMAERRISRSLDPATNEGLPAFLTPHGGVNSGLMIPQYVAASLVSDNQALCTPLPAMSVPTSANQEDVNAMGAGMARNAWTVLENLVTIVGIEAICAAQALEMREPDPAPATRAAHRTLRTVVDTLDEDRVLAPDIEAAARLVRDGTLVSAVEAATGPLAPGRS